MLPTRSAPALSKAWCGRAATQPEPHIVDAQLPQEFETTEGVKGVVVLPAPSVIEHRNMVATLAQKMRLPTMFQRRETASGLCHMGRHCPIPSGKLRPTLTES